MLRLSNHDLDHQVHEGEKLCCGGCVVLDIDLPGMNRVVADDAHDVEGLLDLGQEAPSNEFGNIGVEVFAREPEVEAELLDTET